MPTNHSILCCGKFYPFLSPLLLIDEIIGDISVAHQIQPCALIVELGAGLAAIEEVEGLSGRYVETLGQIIGNTGDLVAQNHFLYLESVN